MSGHRVHFPSRSGMWFANEFLTMKSKIWTFSYHTLKKTLLFVTVDLSKSKTQVKSLAITINKNQGFIFTNKNQDTSNSNQTKTPWWTLHVFCCRFSKELNWFLLAKAAISLICVSSQPLSAPLPHKRNWLFFFAHFGIQYIMGPIFPIPSKELYTTYPTLGKGKSSTQKCL